ncbi:hypothetical protein CKO41_16490 [Thiococcus pfennigii]|nr:hypothetical protein [Thiococcus pfennigii]MBK1733344.1 hypothetical protein [Thiococcus pfennigii]
MKKSKEIDEDELLPEYDLKSLRIRKFGPSRKGFPTHGVVLEPDVADIFPDSNSVNEALRFLMRVTKSGGSTLPDRSKS